MLSVVLQLLLAMPAAPPVDHYPGAVQVFHCAFDESWDRGFGLWPKSWTRLHGPEYPHYVTIKMADDATAPCGGRCLEITLDGGAAVARSPQIPVAAAFDWVLEAQVQTRGLRHDQAFLSLTFLDEMRQPLATVVSEKIGAATTWKKVRLGPISPPDERVRSAIIGLHLEPKSLRAGADLKGSAAFGDVWLGRLPRLTMGTGRAPSLFTWHEPITVTCRASGCPAEGCQVALDLEDAMGRRLARVERPLQFAPSSGTAPPSKGKLPEKEQVLLGAASWQPPLPGPGFYRVRAALIGHAAPPCRQTTSMAVVEPAAPGQGSEFGWIVSTTAWPTSSAVLSDWLEQSGLGWVKLPLCYDPPASDAARDAGRTLVARLAAQRMRMVGVLCRAEADTAPSADEGQDLLPADVFLAPERTWLPLLEPVLAAWDRSIRCWQLGDDRDSSFAGCAQLAEKIAQAQAAMNQSGRDVRLALGWGSAQRLDAATAAKLPQWTVVTPLPRGRDDVEKRAADLVRQMIAAKRGKAEAIFLADPWDPDRGVVGPDGLPGELFLPWRTTAVQLGGADFLGSLDLPGGSHNALFDRSGHALLCVWNDRPGEETLYLGENPRQLDVWGHSVLPPANSGGHVLKVDRLPTFVSGLSLPIARWQMAFALEQDHIPSIPSQPHRVGLRLTNTFAVKVRGRAELAGPDGWTIEPRRIDFQLNPGQAAQFPCQITLAADATAGAHLLRAKIAITADRPYEFATCRRLEVGLGDVYVETATALNAQNQLHIALRMVNRGDTVVDFRCQLYAPGRPRQQADVVELSRGSVRKEFVLPGGPDLLGQKFLLRAEELHGPRVLNYQITAAAEAN